MPANPKPAPPGFAWRGEELGIKPKLKWVAYAWAGVALCLAVAIIMPIDTMNRVNAGKQGINMGGVWAFAGVFLLVAVFAAWLALKLTRISYFFSDTGIRCDMWRNVSAPWSAVTSIEFHRTNGFGQFWVLAPGAVTVAGKGATRDRLIVPCRTLAPSPGALQAQLEQHLHEGQAR